MATHAYAEAIHSAMAIPLSEPLCIAPARLNTVDSIDTHPLCQRCQRHRLLVDEAAA
jgi:hypothetical protein